MAENQKEFVVPLPEDLAKKTGKKEWVIVPPSNLSNEQKQEYGQKAFNEWYLTQTIQPSAAPEQSVYEQNKVPGVGEALYAGLTKGLGDIQRGARQFAARQAIIPGSGGESGKQRLAGLAQEQAQANIAYEPTRSQRPLISGIGEVLPELPFRNPLAVGAIEALKYSPTAGEGAVRGLEGAVATKFGNIIGGPLASYVNPNLNPGAIKSLKEVKQLGISPRLSEITGSPGLAKLEDVVAQTPFGTSMYAPQVKNQSKFNQIAAKSIGEDSEYLTEDVLSKAKDRIGGIYNNVSLTQVPIQFNQKVIDAADKVIARANAARKMNATGAIDTQLLSTAQAWKNMATKGKTFSGEDYNLTRENLSDLAWNAEGSNKIYYRDLLNALDDAAEQSLVGAGQRDLAANLKEARTQYANLKTLEKGNVIENDNVSIAKLRTALKQGRNAAYQEGKIPGDLNKLAKYSEAFKPLKEGSATYPRQSYWEALQGEPGGKAFLTPIVNPALASVLTSPITKFIPTQLAGTPVGKALGVTAEYGAKLPTLAIEKDYLSRRLMPDMFQAPPGILYDENK